VSLSRVARSEADLITVARALGGGLSAGAVEPLLREARPMAERLGPTAMGLLKQTLARGAVLELCRRGGWRPARHLVEGKPVAGRLWERRGPPELRFTAAGYQLLRWLVASPLAVPAQCRPLKHRGATGLGDELLLYLACDLATRCPGCEPALGRSPLVRGSALCWLGFPDLLGAEGPPEEQALGPAWDRLIGEGMVLVEALQQDLARRWVTLERAKRRLSRLTPMINAGESQHRVLTSFAAALERAERRDLLGFVIEAAARLLHHRPGASAWIGGIARRGTLVRRQRAFRAAGALLAGLELPRRWVEQARAVRFFDDEYQASQLLLQQWEQLGEGGLAHAQLLFQRLAALDAAAEPAVQDGP
jgi:hypothetical protein